MNFSDLMVINYNVQ